MSLEGLSSSDIDYLQQSGILEAFHYGLSHLAASGVYLNHTFEPNSVFAAQQIHKEDAAAVEEEEAANAATTTPLKKKAAPTSSTPSLPAIGVKGGATPAAASATPVAPTPVVDVSRAKPIAGGGRDAYELMASYIERFSSSWDMEARTSDLLATLPSSSTAHPKRRPHVSNHINEYIRTQKEQTAKSSKSQDGRDGATSPSGASSLSVFLTEEKSAPDTTSTSWTPEMQLRHKRDTKAYLSSPPRIFSKSPTRDAHGRMAGLYDGSAASLKDTAESPAAQSLNARSPSRKQKPHRTPSKDIAAAAEEAQKDAEATREAEQRLQKQRALYLDDEPTSTVPAATTVKSTDSDVRAKKAAKVPKFDLPPQSSVPVDVDAHVAAPIAPLPVASESNRSKPRTPASVRQEDAPIVSEEEVPAPIEALADFSPTPEPLEGSVAEEEEVPAAVPAAASAAPPAAVKSAKAKAKTPVKTSTAKHVRASFDPPVEPAVDTDAAVDAVDAAASRPASKPSSAAILAPSPPPPAFSQPSPAPPASFQPSPAPPAQPAAPVKSSAVKPSGSKAAAAAKPQAAAKPAAKTTTAKPAASTAKPTPAASH